MGAEWYDQGEKMNSVKREFIHRILCSVFIFLLSCATAVAQDCVKQYAGDKFDFKASAADPRGRPVNIGIVTKGFVGIKGTEVVHGIDVSKFQEDVDFSTLRDCLFVIDNRPSSGPMHAPFVYVRISSGDDPDNEPLYRSHWYSARNQNLYVGPYHSLTVAESKTPVSNMSSGAVQELISENVAGARRQADLFSTRLGRLLLADPLIDVRPGEHGKSYLPIVLAIIARPQSQKTERDRFEFGRAYGAAACEWIKSVSNRPSFRGQTILIFSSASVFKDFDLYSAPCNLREHGVWISQHTLDGSRSGDATGDEQEMATKRLCLRPDGTDLCIFQQYTSFGGFSLFKKDAPLDLDRFYGTEQQLAGLLQHARHPELWK
jgi:hypothetical protein